MNRNAVRSVAAVLAAVATFGVLKGIVVLAEVGASPVRPVVELPRVDVIGIAPQSRANDVAVFEGNGG
jgi:hypothetical protein